MSAVKISGGDKLEGYLKSLVAKVSNASSLEVGFFEDATYPDGTYVAQVAASNEFGATIPAREVPEREVQVYRKLAADGEFANEGRFVKKNRSNWEETHISPAHELPEITVPSRPFFRRMVAIESGHWGADIGKLLKASDYDAKTALGQMGVEIEGELCESVLADVYAPNAQSTIDAKGSDQTLVDSARMLQAVDSKVE